MSDLNLWTGPIRANICHRRSIWAKQGTIDVFNRNRDTMEKMQNNSKCFSVQFEISIIWEFTNYV